MGPKNSILIIKAPIVCAATKPKTESEVPVSEYLVRSAKGFRGLGSSVVWCGLQIQEDKPGRFTISISF